VHPDAWAKAERFLGGRAGSAVATARSITVIHAPIPVVADTVGMPYRRLLGWSTVGTLTWSAVYASSGAMAAASWRQYGDRFGLAGTAGVAVLIGIALLIRAGRRRRTAQQHQRATDLALPEASWLSCHPRPGDQRGDLAADGYPLLFNNRRPPRRRPGHPTRRDASVNHHRPARTAAATPTAPCRGPGAPRR
jgi:hypothetical protein